VYDHGACYAVVQGVAALINKLLAPIRASFESAEMKTLIKNAYPTTGDAFHQAAAAAATES
jgi:hypothetical protein